MQPAASGSQAAGDHAADHGNRRPCDIESHLSKEGKARNLSSLSKFIFSFSDIPDIVSLHGGLPNASIFPFKSMKVELQDGTWLDMSQKDKVCLDMSIPSNGPSAEVSSTDITSISMMHSSSMAQTQLTELSLTFA